MGVFRTKFVTENVEQCWEKGETEGEAQNTTLHAKFSKKPSIDPREPQGTVSNFYERTENVEWAYFVQNLWPKMWSNIELPLPRANRTIFLVLENPTKVNQGYIRVEALLHQHPRLMAHMLRHRNWKWKEIRWKTCCAIDIENEKRRLSLDTKKYRTRGT